MNVLIPMAGAGSRFSQAGFTVPKPLIEVRGKPMIQVVIENLNIEANYIFIVQKEHYEKYSLQILLNLISDNCTIVQVDELTEGAACTTLLAKQHIDNDAPLLIANSDQANVDGSGDACDMTDSFLVTIPVFPPPVLWLMALLIGIMGGRGAVAMRRRSI